MSVQKTKGQWIRPKKILNTATHNRKPECRLPLILEISNNQTVQKFRNLKVKCRRRLTDAWLTETDDKRIQSRKKGRNMRKIFYTFRKIKRPDARFPACRPTQLRSQKIVSRLFCRFFFVHNTFFNTSYLKRVLGRLNVGDFVTIKCCLFYWTVLCFYKTFFTNKDSIISAMFTFRYETSL